MTNFHMVTLTVWGCIPLMSGCFEGPVIRANLYQTIPIQCLIPNTPQKHPKIHITIYYYGFWIDLRIISNYGFDGYESVKSVNP